ncbi:hypothetical protein H2198_005959 [Neophaeococcomyces mojaviensis]|uniref:Uncharacterized protein n=1 Tax=Neophaeococcomyces mojaviensis TaxID=3383035 RepID=A0ACC3A458_9EURO|nr:hypothetical protein H2198_005959 [Knufia sp. JES_112]
MNISHPIHQDGAWISFPESVTLQDVQAWLNVLISFLCAGGTYVVVRFYWQIAARRVANGERVLARSLLSLNTVGETIDLLMLLRHELFTKPFFATMIQSILVICLTVGTLTSGFTARAFTRHGVIEIGYNITGTVARRSASNMLYKALALEQTINDFDRAGVPITKLLDFLPDRTEPWVYVPEQWSHSWTLSCNYTPATIIPNVQSTANCSDKLWSQVPEVKLLWRNLRNITGWYYSYDSSTHYGTNQSIIADMLVFMHGTKINEYINKTASSLTLRTVFMYMQDIPRNATTNATCNTIKGTIQQTTYTEFMCLATKNNSVVKNTTLGAYPESYNTGTIASAYSQQFTGPLLDQTTLGNPMTMLSGEELLRFYQAYLALKDTSTSGVRGWHMLNIDMTVAQVSLACLIVCGVALLVVVIGLMCYWVFVWRNWHKLNSMPESKLDWMLHSLGPPGGGNTPGAAKQRFKHAMLMSTQGSDQIPLADAKSAMGGFVSSKAYDPGSDFGTPAEGGLGIEHSHGFHTHSMSPAWTVSENLRSPPITPSTWTAASLGSPPSASTHETPPFAQRRLGPSSRGKADMYIMISDQTP